MPDGQEVFEASQSATLANVTAAMADGAGGPKFRPGTTGDGGAHYSAPDPPAAFVFSSDQQDAISAEYGNWAERQDRINAGLNGVQESGWKNFTSDNVYGGAF